ncbi:MAG: hypothetical protein ACTSXA_00650 [Candidatus Heimdallarchaeota archaeon]
MSETQTDYSLKVLRGDIFYWLQVGSIVGPKVIDALEVLLGNTEPTKEQVNQMMEMVKLKAEKFKTARLNDTGVLKSPTTYYSSPEEVEPGCFYKTS